MRSRVLGATAASLVACSIGCSGPAPAASAGAGARPPAARATAPAAADALGIADALEARIEAHAATRADREAAYEAVRELVPVTAGDALGRAIVIGRLIEDAGLAKAHLVKDVERWAMKSRELDPGFRDEAAARVLGTLWVLAPAALVERGDSEKGLALLEDLARRRPDVPQNHLRLAEAYLALGDEEPALGALCRARADARRLRAGERELLRRLFHDAGTPTCPEGSPRAAISADPVAPASRSTAPPGAP